MQSLGPRCECVNCHCVKEQSGLSGWTGPRGAHSQRVKELSSMRAKLHVHLSRQRQKEHTPYTNQLIRSILLEFAVLPKEMFKTLFATSGSVIYVDLCILQTLVPDSN